MFVVEIDGEQNQSLQFRPLQRKVRGRWDFVRHKEPQSKLRDDPPIPGQRVGYADGKGFVEESLWDDEHEPVRERLENQGYKLPKRREEFEADEQTWAYWLSRAVDSGVARLVRGKFPTKVDESKVRKSFILHERPSTEQTLTEAIREQNELFRALLTKLTS